MALALCCLSSAYRTRWQYVRRRRARTHRRGLLVYNCPSGVLVQPEAFSYNPAATPLVLSSLDDCIHARTACSPMLSSSPHHPHTHSSHTASRTCYFPGPYARSLVCAGPAKPAFPSLDPRPLTLRPSGTLDHLSTRDPTPGGWPQRLPPKICLDGEA